MRLRESNRAMRAALMKLGRSEAQDALLQIQAALWNPDGWPYRSDEEAVAKVMSILEKSTEGA